ncbi:hypothetical protein HZ326_5428 [Fusarium oxysporum f. sp. albedinis]|nr:hypothetical protein HZ326_5428 [Fusarium oxysporum f. sp. albedinis]
MDPVDIDRIGFLAVPEKEISPASSLPGFFLSSPPVFLSVFFETFYQQYLATFLSLHITIDSGLARASLLPTSRATTFTTYQQVSLLAATLTIRRLRITGRDSFDSRVEPNLTKTCSLRQPNRLIIAASPSCIERYQGSVQCFVYLYVSAVVLPFVRATYHLAEVPR